ncbi:MAG: pyridoxal phosphate-dependent aminotransferase [Christensenellaceae bacterium]|nr:pyridoxal phosphate-dependent aminotransferase [Christensenellaceae bacterium]
MDIKHLMNDRFKNLQGGLFLAVTKADVGEGAGNFMKAGGDIMAWADPFFPDPAIPESVQKALHEAVDDGFAAHYSMPIGDLDLRKTLCEDVNKKTGLKLDPSRNMLVTPGSDSGLLFAMMPFISPGDEIMVPDPSYPSNFLNGKLLGGVTVPVPLYEEDNYQFRMEEFEKRVTDKTKMVLISHPNNPTTTVFRRESIEALCEFVIKHDLILVSDQAFQDHIYDGIEFVHPATLPGMWERTLTVCSISKGIGLSGFRIGYVYTDDVIMDVLYGAAVNVIGASSTLSTIGAIAAVKDEEILKSHYVRLERRRRLAWESFHDIPGVRMKLPESGILSWLYIGDLGTSEEVANRIMNDAKIMVNQGTPYGAQGEGYIRIVTACFARDEDAQERFDRIRAVLMKMAEEKGLK